MNTGNSADNRDDQDQTKGDNHDPDEVPPDFNSARHKAQERGRWVKEAIVKGTMGGAVRELIAEGLERLDF